MSHGVLDTRDFDLYLSLSEKAARDETKRANDAFAAAMNREIMRGRIRARPGTFVDRSPHYGAHRYYGER